MWKKKFLVISLISYIILVFIPGMVFLYLLNGFPILFPKISQVDVSSTVEAPKVNEVIEEVTVPDENTQEQVKEETITDQTEVTKEDSDTSVFGNLRDVDTNNDVVSEVENEANMKSE